jgi:site-specific recombinase XerD
VLWHVWDFVRKEAGLDKAARLYDLRHTFASVGAGGGLSLPIIGRLLGHTQPRTTQRYAHLADDPLREAAEKITTVITGAGKPGAKVVPIKGAQ